VRVLVKLIAAVSLALFHDTLCTTLKVIMHVRVTPKTRLFQRRFMFMAADWSTRAGVVPA
jgi:hypothetical protein